MSLTELQDSVAADAKLHLPDIYYNLYSEKHAVGFESLLLSSLIDKEEPDVAGLRIKLDRDDPENYRSDAYMFTRWSRSQLLSLLGARERWFSLVGLDQQVQELNARAHAFAGYRIRTMRAVDDDFPVRIVRGLVSSEYSEIKNTDIMEAVVAKAAADSKVLKRYSGITDRAFYAYILSPTPITIPNTQFFAYPGAIVKNSEVGYTSLWVVPVLVMRRGGAPVVFESSHVLKRIHRGKPDLPELFDTAFTKVSMVWANLTSQIPHLASKTYGTEADAVEKMTRLLDGAGASKDLVLRAATAYRSQPRGHTALDIFEAVVDASALISDRDESYAVGAIAGALLYKLLF